MEEPKGVRCDLAVEGRPGQVCSIAWSEITFPTNDQHEVAMDRLHDLFDFPRSSSQWTPHISLAYDNPTDSVLKMQDFIAYIKRHPSLLQPRKVKAMSLWSTQGKMADWECYHRVPLGSNDEQDDQ
uniref:Uncharacterized protein n=1 Tax=Grammatophora oceanica TaxID=210454 RepID=A0A7S1UNG8_9STRA